MTTPIPRAFLGSPIVVAAVAVVALGAIVQMVRSGPARAAAASTPGLFMGELVGRDARVQIIGTDHGTLYDVRSPDGRIVAAGLTADEVAALLPGQDPRAVLAQE